MEGRTDSFSIQLRDAFTQFCEGGENEEASHQFLSVLNTTLTSCHPGQETREFQTVCEEVLREAVQCIHASNPYIQTLLDHIGMELPNVVVKFSPISEACKEACNDIINCLSTSCNAREMFTAFMEGINMFASSNNLDSCLPLLHGISLVLPQICRHQAEFIREALPGLLKLACLAADDESLLTDEDGSPKPEENGSFKPEEIIKELLLVAQMFKMICQDEKQSEESKEHIRHYIAGYILQFLAAVGKSSTCMDAINMHQVSELLQFCNISFAMLLYGNLYDELDDEDDGKEKMIEIDKGAVLTVYWMLSDNKVSLSEFQLPSHALLQALNRIKSLFLVSATGFSWKLASKGVHIMHILLQEFRGCHVIKQNDEIILPSIMPTVQMIQEVIIHAPSSKTRQQAYKVFIKVIKEVLPVDERFLCLESLISGSTCPSMVSLLLSTLKDEINAQWPAGPSVSDMVLPIIEGVLHPLGVLPQLPQQMESVLAALNFYRFVLIKEKSGASNYSGIRSKDNLLKSKTGWLIPLSSVLQALQLESSGLDDDLLLTVDMLHSVLYRCIELVEDELKIIERK